MRGGLFSAYFLEDGVQGGDDWPAIEGDRLSAARASLSALLDDFETRHSPNEAETETDLIEPVLRLLGWETFLPQQNAARTGRTDVPDYLLFTDGESKAAAAPLPAAEKYRHGRSILEAKVFSIALAYIGGVPALLRHRA